MSKIGSYLLISHVSVSSRVYCLVGHGLALMNSTGLIWKYSLWLLNRFLLSKEVTCYFNHIFDLHMTKNKETTTKNKATKPAQQ